MVAVKHLGDFACLGTQLLSGRDKSPNTILQTGPQARYWIKWGSTIYNNTRLRKLMRPILKN